MCHAAQLHTLSVGATLADARRHPIKKLLRLLPEEFL